MDWLTNILMKLRRLPHEQKMLVMWTLTSLIMLMVAGLWVGNLKKQVRMVNLDASPKVYTARDNLVKITSQTKGQFVQATGLVKQGFASLFLLGSREPVSPKDQLEGPADGKPQIQQLSTSPAYPLPLSDELDEL